MNELLSILKASWMTLKIDLGEPSFSLAFDTKFILSSKIVFLTSQIESFDEETSNEGLWAELNMISEVRAKSHLWALRYKRVMARLYD